MPKFFYRLLEGATFTGIVLGCASTSIQDTRLVPSSRPPAYDFIIQNRHHGFKKMAELPTSEDNQKWWKKYRIGLLSLEKKSPDACLHFSELSQENHFPLRDIALLRAHQSCEEVKNLRPLNEELYRKNFTYTQDLLAEVLLQEARKAKDSQKILESLRERARFESIPKKKEEYLVEALSLATAAKNEELAESVREQLYKTSPRLKAHPTLKELSSVALDYRHHRQFDRALSTYRQILKNPKSRREEKFQALKNIRTTHKVAQNRNDYINATSQLVNASREDFKKHKKDSLSIKQLHESYILLARTLWTEDRLGLAHKSLSEAQRQLKGLHPLDEVYFVLGRMAEEKGDLTKASHYYEASLKEPLSSTSIRERVLWLHPWVLYKMKNYESAAERLQAYALVAKDPSDKFRSLFWQARALKTLNKSEEASQILQQISKEDSIGYYGILAVRELGQNFTALKGNGTEFTYSLFNMKELTPQAALQAEWLMAVGENAFSEKIIDQLNANLKSKNQTDEQSWMTILTSYARANLYIPLFAAFSGLPQEVKDHLIEKHPELLFPRNYKNLILSAAGAEQIPPEIIFSIIRQESAFNPRARSHADAFGLMQLLPSIAKVLSRNSTIPYKEPDDLFEPEINIPLGAKEIQKLLAKYDRQYILAVSAYNANAKAIQGWLKTRYRPDALEFIEEVPYDETRSYIKLVMRNFVFYKRLNQSEVQSEAPGDKTVPFPEEWLSLTAKPVSK